MLQSRTLSPHWNIALYEILRALTSNHIRTKHEPNPNQTRTKPEPNSNQTGTKPGKQTEITERSGVLHTIAPEYCPFEKYHHPEVDKAGDPLVLHLTQKD